MGGAQCLEDLEQLLAGRLFVPDAVAFHDVEQVLNGAVGVAAGALVNAELRAPSA